MQSLDRLKKRSQFLHLARKGQKVVSPGLIGQVLPREGGAGVRAGFTVTKKVGNSVVRNRTRRRLREALRVVVKEEGCPPSGDVVLIGRAATRQRPFSLLKDDVRKVFRALESKGR
ncbi:ribonuclease P protein component [Parasaccharibacter apium]|nr:ribonuclease P protein component [Parasaccharibacter apium]